jgi:hypothetical protein
MKARPVLVGFSVAACVAVLCVTAFQRREVVALRTEGQLLLAEARSRDASSKSPLGRATSTEPVPRELLQLRNQVGQLRRERDELKSARSEHERLTAELTARGTNTVALPQNYIRKSEARLVGYNSPEDTLQSFLCAVRNGDITNFFQAFTPQVSSQWQRESRQALDKFFERTRPLIGLRIVNEEDRSATHVRVTVEILPGLPPEQMVFQLIGSQWKMNYWPW